LGGPGTATLHYAIQPDGELVIRLFFYQYSIADAG